MSDLDKIVTLESVGLKESYFKLSKSGQGFNAGHLHINAELGFPDVEEIEKNRFDIVLASRITIIGFMSDGEELFTCVVTYHGGFKISDKILFESTEENRKVNFCFSLIYPLVRADVSQTLMRAGLRVISTSLPWNLTNGQDS